jgi:hypothetical protein
MVLSLPNVSVSDGPLRWRAMAHRWRPGRSHLESCGIGSLGERVGEHTHPQRYVAMAGIYQ